MTIRSRSRSWFVVATAVTLVLAFVAPVFAFTYTYPLSSTDIRDAYFIGRRKDEITANFLAKYSRHLDKPASGPYISDISIDTPFTQIVAYSSQAPNFDAPTAVQNFQGKPMRFLAHIFIYGTETYPIAQTNSSTSLYPSYRPFWQDFKITMVQDGEQVVRPLSEDGSFLFSYIGDDSGPIAPIGARVDLSFSPDKIDSATTTIAVDSPDGQHVEATFDLASLR
jgi:hypothetical protein